MKKFISIWLVFIAVTMNSATAEEFNAEEFSKDYFSAWTATQSPTATKENIEHSLHFSPMMLGINISHMIQTVSVTRMVKRTCVKV